MGTSCVDGHRAGHARTAGPLVAIRSTGSRLSTSDTPRRVPAHQALLCGLQAPTWVSAEPGEDRICPSGPGVRSSRGRSMAQRLVGLGSELSIPHVQGPLFASAAVESSWAAIRNRLDWSVAAVVKTARHHRTLTSVTSDILRSWSMNSRWRVGVSQNEMCIRNFPSSRWYAIGPSWNRHLLRAS